MRSNLLKMLSVVIGVGVMLLIPALPGFAQNDKPTNQQKSQTPAVDNKAAQPAKPAASQPQNKPPAGAASEANPEEYAACSPDFPGEQIAEMMEFAAELSPPLADKLKPVLLKCDLKVNTQLLTFIELVQAEIASMDFESEQQEKLFLSQKAKEIEAEILLTQEPVNQAELKKVISELFELRQQGMQAYLATVSKEVDDLKKRVDERAKLKDKIVEKKMKELQGDRQESSQAKSSTDNDPLMWD